MLLFNDKIIVSPACPLEFKNILCYCSTIPHFMCELTKTNLKTSYVIVQPQSWYTSDNICLFKNILCYCSTSEKLDIPTIYGLFKNILCYCSTYFCILSPCNTMAFKNILCYCSTIHPGMSLCASSNLKTSYVIVQRKLLF